MIGPHFQLVAEFFGRLGPHGSRDDAARGAPTAARNVLFDIARVVRPPSPLRLNDHLRRDIGLEPGTKQREIFWPW